MKKIREIIGLIPASGGATRLQPIPCSKELLPVGFRQLSNGNPAPKVISQNLLEAELHPCYAPLTGRSAY